MDYAGDLGLHCSRDPGCTGLVRLRCISVGNLIQVGPRRLSCSVIVELDRSYLAWLIFAGPPIDGLLALLPDLADTVRAAMNLRFLRPRRLLVPDLRSDVEARVGSRASPLPNVPLEVLTVSAPSASPGLEFL